MSRDLSLQDCNGACACAVDPSVNATIDFLDESLSALCIAILSISCSSQAYIIRCQYGVSAKNVATFEDVDMCPRAAYQVNSLTHSNSRVDGRAQIAKEMQKTYRCDSTR